MKHVPLSEVVAELESGSRPKGGVADKGGDIPSLGAEHLDDSGHFKLDKLKLVSRDFFDQMRSGHIHQEDILIVKDGATTGKTSFVDESFPCEKAAINEHVFRLAIEARKAFPKYVFRFLHSPIGLQQILKDFRGATVGGISRGFTDKVSLPFPSLAEQKRIAAILDRADAIRRKRRQAIQLVDEFLRSVFFDMFGNPSSNPKNWKTTPIKSFGKVVTGNTPSRKQPEYYGDHIEWTEVSLFDHATSRMTVEIRGLWSGLPGSWESIPKPAFAMCRAKDRRTSAKAYSVVFSEAYRLMGAWFKCAA